MDRNDDLQSAREHVFDELIPVARPLADRIGAPTADTSYPTARVVQVRVGDDLRLSRSSPADALVDVFLLIGALVVFEVVLATIVELLSGVENGPAGIDDNTEPPQHFLLPLLTLRAVFSVVAVGLILVYRRQSVRSIGLGVPGFGIDVLLGLLTSIAAYALIIGVILSLWFTWPEVADQLEENTRRLQSVVPRLSPIGFVAISLLIGVYEELIFRGFLMTRLRRLTGSWVVAVILSTVVFTALHALDQTPLALVGITIVSLLLSVVTIVRGSLIPAIVGHTLFNLPQFLILTNDA